MDCSAQHKDRDWLTCNLLEQLQLAQLLGMAMGRPELEPLVPPWRPDCRRIRRRFFALMGSSARVPFER